MSFSIGGASLNIGLNLNNNKIKGQIVVLTKNFWDFITSAKVTLQLISATHEGKIGKATAIENWTPGSSSEAAGRSPKVINVYFDWNEEMGLPGAFIIKNLFYKEFLLISCTVDVPGHGMVRFECDSWVYPASKYTKDRIFFSNKTYVTSEIPAPLRPYIEEELKTLRGDGSGKREEWDRVYDYACYNDLGNPDSSAALARPILGGSAEFPYPRRGRTGRDPCTNDPNSESRPSFFSNIYVPCDERFDQVKQSYVTSNLLKSFISSILPAIEALFGGKDYKSFAEILKLFDEGIIVPTINQPHLPSLDATKSFENFTLEIPTEIIQTDGFFSLKYPRPQLIQVDKQAWMTDEEFGREMLAGVNPVVIRRFTEFPVYRGQASSITEEHLTGNLDGLSLDEAIDANRVYILDLHDPIMPYLRRINTETSARTYASRTLLFLKSDGILRPLAIELSLPHPDGDEFGAESKVYTPAEGGAEGTIWMLAKAYVAANDSGYHQLVSHWLNTHCVMEPFVIATNRQLSTVHPIYKLLKPHFLDTMNINALARQILVNAGGIIETIFYPGQFSMELSSKVYKDWVFTDQALPADLIKRGMAIEDETAPHGLRMLVKDYPYAVDGIEIWSAIQIWVKEYCEFYYKTDEMVQEDVKLQSWWEEIREVGHGDKKDEPWWPTMQSRKDLIDSCSTIIWVASVLHAAVNFGQYSYGGYIPNRPTITRKFMPETGSSDLEKTYLETINTKVQNLINVFIISNLSKHSTEEVYLGHRETVEWTTDEKPLADLKKFEDTLGIIEANIIDRNKDPNLKNRSGPAKVHYTLLFPSSLSGISGKGVPNSISI